MTFLLLYESPIMKRWFVYIFRSAAVIRVILWQVCGDRLQDYLFITGPSFNITVGPNTLDVRYTKLPKLSFIYKTFRTLESDILDKMSGQRIIAPSTKNLFSKIKCPIYRTCCMKQIGLMYQTTALSSIPYGVWCVSDVRCTRTDITTLLDPKHCTFLHALFKT